MGVSRQLELILPNFRVARDPGADRNEPQKWLVNAARLIAGRNSNRAGLDAPDNLVIVPSS
jgi:hypothetical protein